MIGLEQAEAASEITVLRQALQKPHDSNKPAVSIVGSLSFAKGRYFMPYLDRVDMAMPTVDELAIAQHHAAYINTSIAPAGTTLLPVTETLDNLDWLNTQRFPLLKSLRVFAAINQRAEAKTPPVVSRLTQPEDMLAVFAGQCLVTAALVQWPINRKCELGLFLHPYEIARLRARFPTDIMSPTVFRDILSKIALRTYQTEAVIADTIREGRIR